MAETEKAILAGLTAVCDSIVCNKGACFCKAGKCAYINAVRKLDRLALTEETRPLITDYTVTNGSEQKVALVFDALDNADGLTKILSSLVFLRICSCLRSLSNGYCPNKEFSRRPGLLP